MRSFVVAFIIPLMCSTASAETGLTGRARDEFVASAFKVCLQKRLAYTRNDAKVAKVARYCVCYSDRLADRITPEENKALDDLFAKDQAQLALKLRPILVGVAEGCASALGSDRR